ncbi:MAG: putative DNA binding domain-containing protein [Verrucomicrobiales bacterium]
MRDDQPQTPDPRIAKLKVRIRRWEAYDGSRTIIDEILALGHAAEVLVPDMAERIKGGLLLPVADLVNLIAHFKSEPLLKAAQEVGTFFPPSQIAQLVTAGFDEFEHQLVDFVWTNIYDEGQQGILTTPCVEALRDYARLSETLDTLIVLEENLTEKFEHLSSKLLEGKRRIELGEMDKSDLVDAIVGAEILSIRRDALREAVAQLSEKHLESELPPPIDLTELESDIHGSITDLIRQEEGDRLEFKASMRWDKRNNELNKDLEREILKTVAAFANKEGGCLLIGVSDSQEVLGLKDDYSTLREANSDKFQLHLQDLLWNHLHINLAAKGIRISFPEIGDKEICKVDVSLALKPVIIRWKPTRKAPEEEEFFVRYGNQSRKLTKTEMAEYIQEHFSGAGGA